MTLSSSAPLDITFHRLREVRQALLELHKALLESERDGYERQFGTIRSKGEYFQLVVSHDWFNWLRVISQLIVKIDETVSSKEPMTLSQADALLQDTRHLMSPNLNGTEMEQKYYAAIQREADIAIMHHKLSKLLEAS
jgi:hypothetical protein